MKKGVGLRFFLAAVNYTEFVDGGFALASLPYEYRRWNLVAVYGSAVCVLVSNLFNKSVLGHAPEQVFDDPCRLVQDMGLVREDARPS